MPAGWFPPEEKPKRMSPTHVYLEAFFWTQGPDTDRTTTGSSESLILTQGF